MEKYQILYVICSLKNITFIITMQAIIYKPTSTAMQSAPNFNNKWILKFIDNSNSKVMLYFDSQDHAIRHAKLHNLNYELIKEHHRKLVKKQYIPT